MLKFILHNLRGLLRFSGRDRRELFWPWVATLIVAFMAMTAAVMVPMMFNMMDRMQAFAVAHPDRATVTSGPGGTSINIQGPVPGLMPDMLPVFHSGAVSAAAMVLLLAAAVARRLHDTGRRGWWGLMPLPFLATGLVVFPRLWAAMQGSATPDGGLIGLLFVNNFAYLGCLAWLAVMCAGAGQPHTNRFGPPPA